jgi:hypothetical protein
MNEAPLEARQSTLPPLWFLAARPGFKTVANSFLGHKNGHYWALQGHPQGQEVPQVLRDQHLSDLTFVQPQHLSVHHICLTYT